MKSQLNLTRFAFSIFLSATFTLPPKLSACEDTWEHDQWTTGSYETDNGIEHCVVTQWESQDYHCTQTANGVNCAIENQMAWEEPNCTAIEPPPPPPDPPGDDDGGGDGGSGCDGESCFPCESPNHFHASDGNAMRRVNDLQIAGAAHGKLTWSRLHNTTPRGTRKIYFGLGGSWRHNWQFELLEERGTAGKGPDYELILPSGVQRVFRATDNGGWAVASSFNEQFAATANGFAVTMASGYRLDFTRITEDGGKNRFEMRTLTDPHGLVTSLEYNAKGYLVQVTEPAGRQLKLAYQDYTFQSGRWKTFGAIVSAPAAGQWVDIAVPENLSTTEFRYLRLLAPSGRPLTIADAQFFAAGGSTPLAGRALGTSDSAAAAFDGNAATLFQSKRGSTNLVTLDLSADNQNKIARIRVLTALGKEAELVGVAIQGMVKTPEVWPLVANVTGSDGRVVNYNYTTMADPYSTQEHIVLSGARYGDGTQSGYVYSYATPNQRPLLVEADDPRYTDRAKRIRYAYQDNDKLGMIRQEINPATGGVYSSLELDPANPEQRTVRYSELRQVSYKIPAVTHNRPTERTDSLGRKTRFAYAENGNGRLVAKIDHAERRTDYARDDRGRATSVFHKQKFDAQNVRDSNGRLISKTDRQGRQTKIDRDPKGRIARTQAFDGAVREFGYDALGHLTTFKQRDGGVHTFAYNSRGLKASWTSPLGHTTTYGYDAQDRLVTITDSLGRIHRREVDERGLTTKTIGPDGTTQQYTYDAYGRRMSTTDAEGRTTKMAYDELGRLTQQEDPVGRVTTYDYTDLPQGCGSCTLADHASRIVHADGMIEKMLYDSEGRLLSRTIAADTPASATSTYTYDNDNHLISISDPLGHVTRYTYDDEDRRVSATDALGRVMYLAYDNHGNVVKAIGPDGGMTTNDYDSSDRLIATKDAAGNITSYTYDRLGNRTSIKDAAGKTTRFVFNGHLRVATIYADGKEERLDYDALGRVIRTVSPDHLETRTSYDKGGHLLATIDNLGRNTAFSYDAGGRRLSSIDPLNRTTQWTYDIRGNILTTTRPDGAVTRNTYDEKDRVLTTTDAAGAITSYTYDAAGNQASLTDPRGNIYRFTYDVLHRKASMTYPDGSQEKWSYDLVGNQTSYTTRGNQTKTTTYNVAHQPVSETWSPADAAPNVVYRYDTAGRLSELLTTTSQSTPLTQLTYTYDKLGHLVSESSNLSALVPALDVQLVKYTYDELNRRSGLVYPNRSRVGYDYDARGRLVGIDTKSGGRTPLASYDYDQAGRIAKLTRENGVTTAYTYDAAGQLTEISHANVGGLLASSRYTLDQLGRRVAQLREDGVAETYGYDIIGQLILANYNNSRTSRETFAYDSVGNRTEVERNFPNGSHAGIIYTSNALNQYTRLGVASRETTCTYDTNGNLTNDGKQIYAYNAQGRLVSVTSVSSGTKMECAYDARNRCVLRRFYTLNPQNQWVLSLNDSRALTYDSGWNLLAERRLDGTQVSEYFHARRTDEILQAKIDGQASYPLLDGLGSTVALANRSGRVVQRYRYDVYGKPEATNSSSADIPSLTSNYRILFTGREWIPSVRLSDHRNRYLSPELGRWISADPIGFRGGLMLYGYAGNNSISGTDPFGLICIDLNKWSPEMCQELQDRLDLHNRQFQRNSADLASDLQAQLSDNTTLFMVDRAIDISVTLASGQIAHGISAARYAMLDGAASQLAKDLVSAGLLSAARTTTGEVIAYVWGEGLDHAVGELITAGPHHSITGAGTDALREQIQRNIDSLDKMTQQLFDTLKGERNDFRKHCQ